MEIDLKRKETIVIVVLILAVVFGVGYRMAANPLASPYEQSLTITPAEKPVSESNGEVQEKAQTVSGVVYVHITGAVTEPGLYHLPEGARIADAVQLAKPAAKADLNLINLAEIVSDQQQIFVPEKGQVPEEVSVQGGSVASVKRSPTGSTAKQSGKININKASLQELDTLPGIGPSYAQRIVEYRESNGGFKTVTDLKKVSGIGDKKFARIKDLITI